MINSVNNRSIAGLNVANQAPVFEQRPRTLFVCNFRVKYIVQNEDNLFNALAIAVPSNWASATSGYSLKAVADDLKRSYGINGLRAVLPAALAVSCVVDDPEHMSDENINIAVLAHTMRRDVHVYDHLDNGLAYRKTKDFKGFVPTLYGYDMRDPTDPPIYLFKKDGFYNVLVEVSSLDDYEHVDRESIIDDLTEPYELVFQGDAVHNAKPLLRTASFRGFGSMSTLSDNEGGINEV